MVGDNSVALGVPGSSQRLEGPCPGGSFAAAQPGPGEPLDLARFDLGAMTACSEALRKEGAGCESLESAAKAIVAYLRERLLDGSGNPACPLVRFYLTNPYWRLEPDLKEFVQQGGLKEEPDPELRYLTLMATSGAVPAWNCRQNSSGHRAIPLVSAASVMEIPMIAGLLQQLGVPVQSVLAPGLEFLENATRRNFGVFHVPVALGSPYIPAQESFVVPYDIRSVLGFGGVLPRGSLFAVILFSSVPIERRVAELFRTVALAVKVAVLPLTGRIFEASIENAEDEDRRLPARLHPAEARMAALEHLLEVHEQAVRSQACGLREKQQQLEVQQARLDAQSEASPDGIVTLTADGALQGVNRRFLRQFERAGAGPEPLSWEDLEAALRAGLREPDSFLELFRKARTDPFENLQIERRGVRDEYFEVSSTPVRSEDGVPHGRVWFFRDITGRKEVERVKNEFISTVSHELRTPLTSIRGALGLLAGKPEAMPPAQSKQLVEVALRNTDRLSRLVNDLLDIEKLASGKMEFTMESQPLLRMLERALEANESFARQYQVRLQLQDDVPSARVQIDPDRFLQVMANLLSNAVKFSPQGSTVTVRVTRVEACVRISVIDRGAGIPEEFRSRIFQRFAQADGSDTKKRGGTGLGLSISKAIAERMLGRLGFESRDGDGTAFHFDLPVLDEVPGPDSAGLFAGPSPGAQRILVCEDDPDIGMLLRLLLQNEGLLVDVVYSASEALAALESRDYSGMTLDLALPDLDGMGLLGQLRSNPRTRHLPVIVVSVKADEARRGINGQAFPIIDWISKPMDVPRLLEAVREFEPVRQGSGRPRILYVEDDPELAPLIARLLAPTGEVVCATSLEQARDLVANQAFNLVLLDLGLPDGSGMELISSLHDAEGTPLPVVVLSGEDLAKEGKTLVAASLVKSRATNEEIVHTIQSILRNARHCSPASNTPGSSTSS